MLNDAWKKVRNFHLAFSHPAPSSPIKQSALAVEARANWINDETVELRLAKTIVDQADAYIDILYFALGGLVELGLVPDQLFDAVHNANMRKLWPDGAHKNVDGKVIKPPGWFGPEAEMVDLIHLQIIACVRQPNSKR